MTFSNQIINLITIPYQTRVLGPVIYGKISIATSLMIYVQLVMDFGFLLSATEKVASNRDDNKYLNKLFTTVTITKTMLGVLAFCGIFFVCTVSNSLKTDRSLYLLYFLAFGINAFLPDFIYRGMEKMKSITIRTVIIKALFASTMLVFVRSSEDYYRLPILLGVGNLMAVLFSVWHINKQFNITFTMVGFSFIKKNVVDAFPFFVSRIASTFYQALNTVILGILYPGEAVIGFYGSADKLLAVAKSVSSPVADSIYPYMVRRKDYSLVKKVIIFTGPIIVLGAAFVFIKAEWVCVLLFGSEYIGTANILRCILPAMMVIFPTYLLCFPVLIPMGLSKYANMSNVLGAIIQVVLLAILLVFNNLNVYSICISSSISEVSVFLFRLFIVLKYRERMKLV